MSIISLIALLVILGLVAWLVNKAPVIEATFKTFIVYALLVVGAIAVIYFLLGLVGGHNLYIR